MSKRYKGASFSLSLVSTTPRKNRIAPVFSNKGDIPLADTNTKVQQATQFLVAQLKQLNQIPFGLTDAKIAAITAAGTVAKLKTAIAALTVKTIHSHYRDNIPAAIDRCLRYSTLTNADVETARAAGTFAALLTAIDAHSTASIDIRIGADVQAYSIWAG